MNKPPSTMIPNKMLIANHEVMKFEAHMNERFRTMGLLFRADHLLEEKDGAAVCVLFPSEVNR